MNSHDLHSHCEYCEECLDDSGPVLSLWEWHDSPYDRWVEWVYCEPCYARQSLLGRRWSGPWISHTERGTRPPLAVYVRRMLEPWWRIWRRVFGCGYCRNDPDNTCTCGEYPEPCKVWCMRLRGCDLCGRGQ